MKNDIGRIILKPNTPDWKIRQIENKLIKRGLFLAIDGNEREQWIVVNNLKKAKKLFIKDSQ